MTIADWLETRTPAPPSTLAVALRGALAPVLRNSVSGDGEEHGAGAHAELLRAAEALLVPVMRGGSAGRHLALDLLSADALVTYAFEAAAEDPDSIAALADAAMRSIGALAVDGCP